MGVIVTLPVTLQNGTSADATQVMADLNALVAGFLSAAAAGANSDITALLGLTTPIPYTVGGTSAYIGGTSTGTANAQIVGAVVPNGFSLAAGKRITFIAGVTNTGATQINVNAQGLTNVFKRTPAGPVACTGGEIVAGNLIEAEFDGTQFQLLTDDISLAGPLTNLASATSTDLGTVPNHNVNITGTTTITGFGSTASTTFPIYQLTFAGALVLTQSSALLIPGGYNVTTQVGDTAIAMYLGSGNWKILQYTRGLSIPGNQTISGGYRNLTVLVISDTQVTTTTDALTLENANNTAIRLYNVSVTAAITSSGANGLDTGSEASNTWYNKFVIYNPTTGAAGALLSLSATAPTLPAGYPFFVRTGVVRNDGSSNFWRTLQKGPNATIKVGTNPTVRPTLASGSNGSLTTPTWVVASVSAAAPPTASQILVVIAVSAGLNSGLMVAPNTSYGAYTSTTNPPPLTLVGTNTTAVNQYSTQALITLESANIFYASSTASGLLFGAGWTDNL